jgi:lysophospholipase L1-like esterase
MRGLAVVLLTLGALLTSGLSAAADTGHYAKYVALGDSYTAGPLIPLQRLDPLGCARSTQNYPSQLAAKLHVTLDDVSCSGADTANMTQPQVVPLGINPPQLNALDPDTDLVTVSIGGNDDNVFGNLVGTCPTLRAEDPTGNPCQRHYTSDGVDLIKAELVQTQQHISAVLAEIHHRSPIARVMVIGIPRIVPPTGTCPSVAPFADGDYPWIDSVERSLNAAMSNAAAETSASYVDTYGPSLGHDICAGANAWINGQYLKLDAAPYHPNLAGMTGEANIIARAMN